jgi:hypothetical protein
MVRKLTSPRWWTSRSRWRCHAAKPQSREEQERRTAHRPTVLVAHQQQGNGGATLAAEVATRTPLNDR